jgi:hypothetical protein
MERTTTTRQNQGYYISRKDSGMLNEASPEAVRSIIQADGHFTFIRLFTVTRAATTVKVKEESSFP